MEKPTEEVVGQSKPEEVVDHIQPQEVDNQLKPAEVDDQLKPEENQSNNDDILDSIEEKRDRDAYSVIKDEKGSDSDANSEDLSSNDEQNNVNSGSSPQFYESSDSKSDYAVKIDDNDTLSDIDDIKTDTASADSEDSALGSLPPDTVEIHDREEEAQDRSDGSDSGIGSETPEDAKIPNFNLPLPCTSKQSEEESTDETKESVEVHEEIKTEPIIEQSSVENTSDSEQIFKPQKSNLKRKCDDTSEADQPKTKRRKEGIKFDSVTVYYFPRAQGFSCVPSQGGSTLGMELQHSHVQKFTLAEHALEQRRLHRQILQQIKNERHSLEGEALSSSDDSDTEEEASDISESELDLDSYYFLQPVPTRQRRALLRAAGVRKIEGYEKDECRNIRTSREFCGCACKGTCNPETCLCSLGGIKCQVDRLSFPCGCTRDGCANTSGRIEFNPVRVRTHFIHTLMRIGLEKKNEENQEAAKRQWAALNGSTSATNTSYDSDRSISHEDGLVRDVSLTPRVEVESCVNNGSFNNVHCEMNNTMPHATVQDNSNYVGYGNDALSQKNMNPNNVMHFDNGNSHHNHNQAYTNNILQGKGPPYTTGNTMALDTMSNNMQTFPCDLNYSYEQHMENHYKVAQSYSASSFEEFAHNSQMTMFSHYGHMYAPEYFHKPSTSMHDHNALQYHAMPQQDHYGMYKNTPDCINTENKNDSHYTTLMTMPYQSSNKLQTVENDENWFSQNNLMSLDQADQSTQEAPEMQTEPAEPAPPADNSETTENFGELIKKTMVESVTV
ncbi:cysteine/serine-rich nuclear protein 3 [Phthorimaea operculella]|nr:cysteine/serine-rich nuclear protein 3 [Phthorimaea operculella]